MAELFVDTSAWYPAIVTSHPDHEAVAGALQAAVQTGVRLITTNLVVAETHALLLHRVGRQVALTFARTIYQPPTLVVPSTAELELRAVTDWIAEYGDQSFSLTDAVSFVVMKSRKITGALTLDSHFAVAGFTTEPATARPIRRKR